MMNASSDESMDLEILVGFIDESLEGICQATDDILTLGRKGFVEGLIQSVFRVFHSIKGNSAFFGLFPIKDLSHTLEQVFDKVRKHELELTPLVIDRLLEGVSVMNTCFSRVRESGIQAITLDDVSETIETLKNTLDAEEDTFVFLNSVLDELANHPDKDGTLLSVMERISRYIHRKGGESDSHQSGDGKDRTIYPEYLLPIVLLLDSGDLKPLNEEKCVDIERFIADLETEANDERLAGLIEAFKKDFNIFRESEGLDPVLRRTLLEKLSEFPDMKVRTETVPRPDSDVGIHTGTGKTMRVSEFAVDQFLSFVGELVVVEEMYSSIELQMADGRNRTQDLLMPFRKTTEMFKGLSRQLQRSIMEIRKVPINNLFQRMPKIVHDVAREKKKEIELKIENGGLLVDKSLVEKLEAPLVHMVRNAADHGIETPEKRLETGKKTCGRIVLSAEEKGDSIRVKVRDDGSGINLDKIRDKALELGIIDSSTPLHPDRILDVMFCSGVSTAEEVTDISGRGVGMDVVRKNIEEAGGTIRTETQHGQGTTFILSLPSSVTTQIIQGFIVRSGSERCIIPLDTVSSSLSLNTADISTVQGKSSVLRFEDRLIPVQNLRSVVDSIPSNGVDSDEDSGIIIVTHVGNTEKAYVVDVVEGIRQVVVKPIQRVGTGQMDFISGGAIMGDGTVALILDMEKIMMR